MKALLIDQLKKYNPAFSDAEIELGMARFVFRTCKAKELVLKAGDVCDTLFLAKSSITRCFYHDEEESEQTLWMKPEGTFITEYKSFVGRQPSRFSLQTYEETKFCSINREDLLALYKESPNWALFGIHLTEQTHNTLIDVFVNLLANDATRNYQYIAYQFPRFLQVAPLKDIASMLQVTPVTLSRIRAGTQTKGNS